MTMAATAGRTTINPRAAVLAYLAVSGIVFLLMMLLVV